MSGIDLSQLTLWLPALQTAAWLVAALALVAMAMAGFDIAAEIRALGKTLDDAGTSGPLNVNINLMASRATQSLNSAVASKGGTAAPREVARTVSAFARPQVFRRLQGTRVLWVDDIPANNLYERRAMEALGMDVSVSTDTDDALRQLAMGNFDLIVSDMGRPSGKWAGYALLDVVKKHFPAMPFVIYSASSDRKRNSEAKKRGARHATNDARDLLAVVVKVLGGG